MERKELLHVIEKKNNSIHPKARLGDHKVVPGKSLCVIFIFELHLWGQSARSSYRHDASRPKEKPSHTLKLPVRCVYVFVRAVCVGSKRDIRGETGSLADIFRNLLRNRNRERAQHWPLTASRWMPTC